MNFKGFSVRRFRTLFRKGPQRAGNVTKSVKLDEIGKDATQIHLESQQLNLPSLFATLTCTRNAYINTSKHQKSIHPPTHPYMQSSTHAFFAYMLVYMHGCPLHAHKHRCGYPLTYVYLYIDMHIYMYIYMWIYIYSYKCIYVHIYQFIYSHLHVGIHKP